jgi:glutaminyl-peptide cyclotransferase
MANSPMARRQIRTAPGSRSNRAIRAVIALTFLGGCGGTDSPSQADDPQREAAAAKVQTAAESTKTAPDSKRAYGYLRKITRIGPRFSGSRGMLEQQRLLIKHFTDLGGEVKLQSFDAPHPQTGRAVRMNNLVVSWHPQRKERVLLACHYDTRPYPDRDRLQPRGRFVGANDGASGVALFMELAHHLPKLDATYGVDFVFFDGEELVFSPDDKYFLGSEYFPTQYRDKPPTTHSYVYGVLVDMIGDKRLNIYMEKKSAETYAPELTRSIWAMAKQQKVREFIPRVKHEVNDDHVPLNEIAKIPTCDIIDFDYPHWHTTRDIATNCSGSSLAKVGRVLLAWLAEVPKPKTE